MPRETGRVARLDWPAGRMAMKNRQGEFPRKEELRSASYLPNGWEDRAKRSRCVSGGSNVSVAREILPDFPVQYCKCVACGE